ncbi:polymorphic toxin-type HINT domain-containing protein [Plantactinospora sp. WMMB782]|uniref:polymorphic toxin-type HINT domain-containing protein n=1 Tax=Plantactinospora sp. WMMB782 TaxID=3404121 RepID=UPI003B95AE37
MGSFVTGWMDGQRGWDLALMTGAGALLGGLTGGALSAVGAGVKGAVGAGIGGRAGGFANGFKNEVKNIVGKGCKHSFDPDTPVLMADGSTKPIKDVKTGDRVLATDPETGETTGKKVVATHVNIDKDLADVTVVDPKTGARATLHTTQSHPFWNDTAETWTDAKGLRSGDRLASPGRVMAPAVLSVSAWDGTAEMRDLTVAEVHTYYVMAGGTPVLVHNCNKNQGVYIFDDVSKPDHVYVGQTNNFRRRLGEHMGKGRLSDPKDAICIHVCGSEDDLKVMEFIIKDQLQEYGLKLSSPIEPNTRNVYNSLRRFIQKPLFRMPDGES